MNPKVTVVGAGLAGSECAFQLAERGVQVELLEQKPVARTPAQRHDFFAELVCSNSLRGAALTNAVGLLKEEMRLAGSLIMEAAIEARVPAGGALAVDREVFGHAITTTLRAHPQIQVTEGIVDAVPERDHPVVLATGPLTGDALAADLGRLIGEEYLAYYDAIAPVVSAESVDWDIAFRASRYDKGSDAAYGNCPMDEPTYLRFVQALVDAEKVQPREFEELKYFEGCLPVEEMASRGPLTLAFGPMKPVGLIDPRTGQEAFAVVQLRQEDIGGTAFNLVGFQTRLKWPEQERIFRTIPGLERAEFERLGSIHRNTFVRAPEVLDDQLQLKARAGVYLAGQITGVEGYVESAACGLLLGRTLAYQLLRGESAPPPPTTALGGLYRHLRTPREDFQPSNVVWGHLDPLPGRKIRKRAIRREKLAERALEALPGWLQAHP